MTHKSIRAWITILLLSVQAMVFFISAQDINKLFELPQHSLIYRPTHIDELSEIVVAAAQKNKKIALIGANKSQGGQTFCSQKNAIYISLDKLNKLVLLDLRNKQATVEAGMTWAELEKIIAPHELAIKAMQSYNDFSIGGSLGVNVHGQDFRFAPLIETVLSFKLLMPNGSILHVDRNKNAELFGLAIGGYGLFGIITEVTLSLTHDRLLERKAKIIKSKNLSDYFQKYIKHNPHIEFYSARFSMGATDLLDRCLIITYEPSNNLDTSLFNLASATKDSWKKLLLDLTNKFQIIKNWRFTFESLFNSLPHTISRNNFLNISIDTLLQDMNSHYILQEYFIPYEHLQQFIQRLKKVIIDNHINIINVTARHVHKSNASLLSYSSQQDMCALVLYVKIDKNRQSYQKVQHWTNLLIEEALSHQGTYYLPYHLLGTKKQLESAYPTFRQFVNLKKQYDPQELFSNMLYETYA